MLYLFEFFADKIQTRENVLGGEVVVAVEIDQVIVDVVLLQVQTRDAVDVEGASRRVVAKSLLKYGLKLKNIYGVDF